MSSNACGSSVDRLAPVLDAMATIDVTTLDDGALRGELLGLLTVANRVHAEVIRRVDVFDRRRLSEPDGFRNARAWLQGFGRLSGVVAHRLVRAARALRRLPKLAAAAQDGDVSSEHVQRVSRLADQVGMESVVEVDATLTDAGRALDPGRFATVCDRVAAHLAPDGSDPAEGLHRRSLTLAPVQGMMVLRGQLDAEGGAAVATALDALLAPPAGGDERTPGQRRADALVELARRQLSAGTLPTVGGQRPQVGVLLYPQALSPETLARLADAHRDDAGGARLRELVSASGAPAEVDWTRPQTVVGPGERFATGLGRSGEELRRGLAGALAAAGRAPAGEAAGASGAVGPGEALAAGQAAGAGGTPDHGKGSGGGPPRAGPGPPAMLRSPAALRPTWSASGWADPPWLNWVGSIPPAVAQRIACDADIWRIILDPASGLPLDVGRGHRLVPHWIRRALHARDRGCPWVGCDTPAEWTDAHHVDCWADGGETKVERCLLLCRYHHGLVHEGGWSIDLDPATGEVVITRPGGIPFLVPRGRSPSWNGPTTQAA